MLAGDAEKEDIDRHSRWRHLRAFTTAAQRGEEAGLQCGFGAKPLSLLSQARHAAHSRFCPMMYSLIINRCYVHAFLSAENVSSENGALVSPVLHARRSGRCTTEGCSILDWLWQPRAI